MTNLKSTKYVLALLIFFVSGEFQGVYWNMDLKEHSDTSYVFNENARTRALSHMTDTRPKLACF